LTGVFGSNSNINYKTSGDMSLTVNYVSIGNSVTRAVIDSAAPVIVSAQYYSFNSSTINDTLVVSFSEKMSVVNNNTPFKFWTAATPSYLVTVNDVNTDSNTVTFYVVNFPDNITPSAGDSIWIYADHEVMDVLGVEQMVDTNKKQPLSLYSAFSIQSAAYYDTDTRPDGYIDLIRVTMNTAPGTIDFSNLASAVALPAGRYFNALTAGNFMATASGFDINVVQSRTSIPFDQVNTAVDADDKLIISASTAIGNNSVILPASVAITDSLAPVVVSGLFCPKAETDNTAMKDTLITTFSENVKVPSANQPFSFFDISGVFPGGYSMTLTPLSTIQGKALTFLVDATQKAYPQNGDSLWIIGGNNVEDIVSIVQTKDTKPAPLTVKPYPLILSITVLNPVQLSNPEIHANLVRRYDLGDNNTGCLVIVDISGHIEDPQKLTGELYILDAVGNKVQEDIKANYVKYFDKDNMEHNALTMVWDLRNRKARFVGPATYCGIITVKNDNTMLEQKRVLIGVKY
jgi:hypothetical protein